MDRQERVGSPTTALLAAFEGWQAGIWTTMVGVLVPRDGAPSFDPVTRTVRVQLVTQVRAQNPDGTFDWITIPVLPDVIVIFPSGGGCTLTFPLKDGDEVMVFLASRCVDAWYQNGGKTGTGTPTPQVQLEFRMHDLSDGFCLAGVNSLPFVIPDISTSTAQFRSDTGDTYVEVDPADGFVNVITPGNVGVQAGGNIAATAGGNITADAGGEVEVSSGGTTTVNAHGGCIINAETENNGNVTINGNLTVNGHISFTAGISGHAGGGGGAAAAITGTVAVTSGNVTADGVGLKTHVHGNVTSGSSSTGGPSG